LRKAYKEGKDWWISFVILFYNDLNLIKFMLLTVSDN
jgi:hypothetical protein